MPQAAFSRPGLEARGHPVQSLSHCLVARDEFTAEAVCFQIAQFTSGNVHKNLNLCAQHLTTDIHPQFSNGFNPAQLLMNRHLRTTLPTVATQLQPSLPYSAVLKAKEKN